MSELKPCPFCGEEPINADSSIFCNNDRCMVLAQADDNEYHNGNIDWNHRPIEGALRARITELETILAGDCAPCKCFQELMSANSRVAELEKELAEERAGRPLLARATDTINDLQARNTRLEEALREIVTEYHNDIDVLSQSMAMVTIASDALEQQP